MCDFGGEEVHYEDLDIGGRIISRVLVTIRVYGILDWLIGFIAPYTFTQIETTGNTAL
jgi:hypothetical protein